MATSSNSEIEIPLLELIDSTKYVIHDVLINLKLPAESVASGVPSIQSLFQSTKKSAIALESSGKTSPRFDSSPSAHEPAPRGLSIPNETDIPNLLDLDNKNSPINTEAPIYAIEPIQQLVSKDDLDTKANKDDSKEILESNNTKIIPENSPVKTLENTEEIFSSPLIESNSIPSPIFSKIESFESYGINCFRI
ncbi:hypothetical protein AYI68_g1290 [Smittium mucronatum]|uniref:Uncharacterized protein n=1 Tax=Smittium mucronatum TaxID=133383 RepID=A0A1R0H5Z7_9FUNG|nr:hypothetical protein AYI68_g1290 [Smittium mucronatum]